MAQRLRQEFCLRSGRAFLSTKGAPHLSALGIALGLVQPGPEDVSRYDVAPLLSGIPVGDGVIDIEDVVVLLRIASGLPN